MEIKKETAMLAPDVVLRYIINPDNNKMQEILDQDKIEIVSSFMVMWEVMSCLDIKEIRDNAEKIEFIFKKIKCFDLQIRTPHIESKERIEHLRSIALD